MIRNDGLVEFALIHPKRMSSRGDDSRIYIGWVIGVVAGAVAQIDRIRSELAWDAVEYGLEIQMWGTPPLGVFWTDEGYSDGYTVKTELPLTLPRYSLA